MRGSLRRVRLDEVVLVFVHECQAFLNGWRLMRLPAIERVPCAVSIDEDLSIGIVGVDDHHAVVTERNTIGALGILRDHSSAQWNRSRWIGSHVRAGQWCGDRGRAAHCGIQRCCRRAVIVVVGWTRGKCQRG